MRGNLEVSLRPRLVGEGGKKEGGGVGALDLNAREDMAPRFLFFAFEAHDTGDNNTRDQRPVALTRKALNLRTVFPLSLANEICNRRRGTASPGNSSLAERHVTGRVAGPAYILRVCGCVPPPPQLPPGTSHARTHARTHARSAPLGNLVIGSCCEREWLATTLVNHTPPCSRVACQTHRCERQLSTWPDDTCTERQLSTWPDDTCTERQLSTWPDDTCTERQLSTWPDDTCTERQLSTWPDDTCTERQLSTWPDDTCTERQLSTWPDDTCTERQLSTWPDDTCTKRQLSTWPDDTCTERQLTCGEQQIYLQAQWRLWHLQYVFATFLWRECRSSRRASPNQNIDASVEDFARATNIGFDARRQRRGISLLQNRGRGGLAVRRSRLLPRLTRFDSRWGRSRIFASENRAGRCRCSAGFLVDLPLPLSLHSDVVPFSPHCRPPVMQSVVTPPIWGAAREALGSNPGEFPNKAERDPTSLKQLQESEGKNTMLTLFTVSSIKSPTTCNYFVQSSPQNMLTLRRTLAHYSIASSPVPTRHSTCMLSLPATRLHMTFSIAWLQGKGVSWDETMRKATLIKFLEKHRPREKIFAFDRMLTTEAVEAVTKGDWVGYCRHVEGTEEYGWDIADTLKELKSTRTFKD
ncbi:hypothetical protein PR048_032811 [Dryococelus australis]|uniref:Uncharacterized protein n=1 Tax=Dryococelus australis TaxID=614101 RepID=A0ABQ9G3A1_9NEOP|nr:hypothetical protein PR048_032811 [Dryococelus australis]